ncbi:MAG: hypothetical protein ACLT8E_10750 [Akkermansia sp.]
MSLPWVALASGLGLFPELRWAPGILLGVASVACAVVALCRKSVAFGIIMTLIGMLARAVAGTECMYLMF